MSKVLFITFCLSIFILSFEYLASGFSEITPLLRLGWGGICFVALMGFLLGIHFLIHVFTNALKQKMSRRACGSDPISPGRRKFIKTSVNLAIIGASGALTTRAAYEGMRLPDVFNVSVSLDNIPGDLKNFHIVQISDLHIDLATRTEWLLEVIDRVNSLSPDMVAFTGDMADVPLPMIRDRVALLSSLSAKYGCYLVTGNHEYYSGKGIEAAGGPKKWEKEMERLGFIVLINDHRILQLTNSSILIAGVTDYWAGLMLPEHASDPEAAVRKAPPSDVRILLAHQPNSIYDASKQSFDLQLSGHTHGGQFFPGHIVMGLTQPFISGLHKYKEKWIYVNRGTGYWGPPLRLGASAEITSLKLT